MINQIIQEMNLREPLQDSLIKFTQIIENIDIENYTQERIKRILQIGTLQFTDTYARLTFALATGIGKTRLMGALQAYLYNKEKSKHFVMMAPGKTIYKKMLSECIPTDPKYLFKGLSGFPTPKTVYADNIETYNPEQLTINGGPIIFILTPGQIRASSGSEVERRLRREGEGFGDSFVEHLANLDDLVVFLDEGHRYGQDTNDTRAWKQAIIDLRPKLVIEMTATPTNTGTVLHEYNLREALREGKYIKNVTAIYESRQAATTDEEWDKHTLLEGYRRLQIKKSAIEAFKNNYPNTQKVKPIILISARDTTHAAWIEEWLLSDEFLSKINEYIFRSHPLSEKISNNQVLRVDITQSEDDISKILEVEKEDNPIEIVINVGMLKEGWDVTNVYVIIPLRAMISETLSTQTIGRGLRLPYGQRVGDEEVDTLDVLTFGRETIQQVIENARNIGIKVNQNAGGGDMTFLKIIPNTYFKIVIPSISLKVKEPPDVNKINIERHVDIDLNRTAEITRITATTGETEIIADSLNIDVKKPAKRIAQMICNDIPEITGQTEDVEKIILDYLMTAGCETNDKQNNAIKIYGGNIYDDIKKQIDDEIRKLESEYQDEKEIEEFIFTEVTHSVNADNPEIENNSAQFPKDKQRGITGWRNSVYDKNKFSTPDELLLAKIIDKDDSLKWVRNPVHQFEIQTQAGSHFPDFIVLKDNTYYFIEVKNDEELHDNQSTAYLKGKASTEWCKLATEISNEYNYEYCAIPYTRVSGCNSLNDIISNRFIFTE